jgi:KDO2-lipid IV(A) lauroyltransferase
MPAAATATPAPPRQPAEPNSTPGALRRAAADVWLDLLFRCAGRPALTRLMKPLVVGLGFCCSRQMRSSTAANARRIFGPGITPAEARAFGRRVLGNFYDFVCDVGLSRSQSRQQMAGRIEPVQHHERYVAARAARRGAIIATAHMGSFEAGAVALLEHEAKIHVVFRRDPSRFEQVRSALRQKLGILEAPVDQGWGVWMRLRDALLRDEVVMVQADRVMPGQKGIRVPFLHGHVMLPTGPVKLALASGAPIVPVFAIRAPAGKIRICVEEPIAVEPSDASPHPALLQLAATIERYVRANPDQWLMFQSAFCEDATP